MSLSAYERETIINYNDDEKTAVVYTCNQTLRKRMDAIVSERPNDCKRTKENEHHAEYVIPKSWVKIRPNRILTDEQKVIAAERMRRVNAERVQKNSTETER